MYDGLWKSGKKNGKFNVLLNGEKSSITYIDDEDIIEIYRRKKEAALASLWSDFLGRMDHESAVEQCKSLKMRLPTLNELKIAYKNGTTRYWKSDDDVYWSSTPYIRVQYYRGHRLQATWYHGIILDDDNFSTNEYPVDLEWGVRCRK